MPYVARPGGFAHSLQRSHSSPWWCALAPAPGPATHRRHHLGWPMTTSVRPRSRARCSSLAVRSPRSARTPGASLRSTLRVGNRTSTGRSSTVRCWRRRRTGRVAGSSAAPSARSVGRRAATLRTCGATETLRPDLDPQCRRRGPCVGGVGVDRLRRGRLLHDRRAGPNRIAALDVTTGLATSWDPNADSTVRTLAVSGSTVYAGGDFTRSAGRPETESPPSKRPTGTATVWNADANGTVVYALAVSGPTVYARRRFQHDRRADPKPNRRTRRGHRHCNGLGSECRRRRRHSGDSGLDRLRRRSVHHDRRAEPGPHRGARRHYWRGDCLESQRERWRVHAGGVGVDGLRGWRVHAIGGQIRTGSPPLRRLPAARRAGIPNPDNTVFTLAVRDSTVYAGGAFTTIGEEPEQDRAVHRRDRSARRTDECGGARRQRPGTVSFTAPASDGGSAISSYTVISSPGGFTASGAPVRSPSAGLTNGTSYTFTVHGDEQRRHRRCVGPSNAVMPAEAPGRADRGVRDGRQRPGDRQLHRARVRRRRADHRLHRHLVARRRHRERRDEPDHRTGLTNGTSYTFTVTATNSAAPSAPSAPSNAVTPAGVPGAPTGATATAGDARAIVELHGARIQRRRPDHLVHRHLVARRRHRRPARQARSP